VLRPIATARAALTAFCTPQYLHSNAGKFCAGKMITRAARMHPRGYAAFMATLSERNPDNVPGPYYTDSSCIDCDQCRVIAPDFFTRNEDTGMTYVTRQPVTAEEIELVEEARLACATESIGTDGN
jgi:ferredoxin